MKDLKGDVGGGGVEAAHSLTHAKRLSFSLLLAIITIIIIVAETMIIIIIMMIIMIIIMIIIIIMIVHLARIRRRRRLRGSHEKLQLSDRVLPASVKDALLSSRTTSFLSSVG